MTNKGLNAERARRCREILIGNDRDGLFTSLIDLLADAMHWCDQSGEDFHYALCVAGGHYLAELNDQPHDERRLP